MERRKTKKPIMRQILTLGLIVLGIGMCSIATIAGLDFRCGLDIDKWQPVYPDAELVDTEESGFFRDRASGRTIQTYYTSDEPVLVRRWYSEYRRELTSGQYNVDNPNASVRGLSTNTRQITEDPDTGGSYIRLFSECAYS